MATTNSPLLSSSSSNIDMQQWLNNLTQTFNNHLQINTNLPVCIFQVPQTLTTQKPDSYIPKNVGFGPIHHLQTNLYNKQQQLKLITAKKVFTHFKITSQFEKLLLDRLVNLVPVVRFCYNLYFDINDECLAWVFAIDAIHLLDVMSMITHERPWDPHETDERPHESFEDVMMLENQIPLVIMIELLTALDQNLTSDFDNSFLSNLLVKFCETRSPLKFTTNDTLLDLDISNRFHLLDCMYHLIVNYNVAPENPFLRVAFLMDVHLEDVENAVQIAGGLFVGANAFLQPVLLVLKLPWDKISVLIKKLVGEHVTTLEIDIPSVSKLSRIGKIEIFSTSGGIHDVEFDEEKLTLSLPVLDLKFDSEVILRNLVAYEELMFKNGSLTNLDFTEYVDLMCGIIDGVKDVKILREKNIIEGDLGDEEIVKLFNEISKSNVNKHGKKSALEENIAKVNKYYGNLPRVKVFRVIKKLFLASWKFFAVVFSGLSLVLMIVSGVCQVYECKDHFGLGNLQFALGNNQLVEF